MATSDLPFGSEFSPSQVDLSEILDLAHNYAGDPDGFETAVRALYFEKEYSPAKLANNTNLAMRAYGLIDDEINLTQVGRQLYNLRKNLPALYRELARHILLNLHGAVLVQCVQDIQAAGEKADLAKLREWLAEKGIHFPPGGKHPSIMRLWLQKAGVFTSGWTVDDTALKSIPRRRL